jgi:hypothetical protein
MDENRNNRHPSAAIVFVKTMLRGSVAILFPKLAIMPTIP